MQYFFIKIFFILFFLKPTNEQLIRSYMAQQQQAWNNGNIDKFMEHYWKSDSLKFIGKKGITYGWQNTLDNYKKSYPTKNEMGTLQFSNLQFTPINKSYVYVIGQWNLQREKPIGGYFTLLWKKINGKWVIINDHSS